MKKSIICLLISTLLLSVFASALEVSDYNYSIPQRFSDQFSLMLAKVTKNQEKQVQLRNTIMERRMAHFQAHPSDVEELTKYEKDAAELDKLSADKATFEKHLAVLQAVQAKLQAKNVTASGLDNAISNANGLVAKKAEKNGQTNTTTE